MTLEDSANNDEKDEVKKTSNETIHFKNSYANVYEDSMMNDKIIYTGVIKLRDAVNKAFGGKKTKYQNSIMLSTQDAVQDWSVNRCVCICIILCACVCVFYSL